MSWGWIAFLAGVGVGAVFSYWGFLAPPLMEAVVWVVRKAEGAFVNHSGSGDNLGALGLGSALIWTVIGLAGVLVGLTLRQILRRRLPPWKSAG
jgi:hypothetical protein